MDKSKYWEAQLSEACTVYEALAKVYNATTPIINGIANFAPDTQDSEERYRRDSALHNMNWADARLIDAGKHWLDIVNTLEACLNYPTITKPFWEVQP